MKEKFEYRVVWKRQTLDPKYKYYFREKSAHRLFSFLHDKRDGWDANDPNEHDIPPIEYLYVEERPVGKWERKFINIYDEFGNHEDDYIECDSKESNQPEMA
jgi:hypothetical protein